MSGIERNARNPRCMCPERQDWCPGEALDPLRSECHEKGCRSPQVIYHGLAGRGKWPRLSPWSMQSSSSLSLFRSPRRMGVVCWPRSPRLIVSQSYTTCRPRPFHCPIPQEAAIVRSDLVWGFSKYKAHELTNRLNCGSGREENVPEDGSHLASDMLAPVLRAWPCRSPVRRPLRISIRSEHVRPEPSKGRIL